MGTAWVRRVLVVEDQAAMRTLVCDLLDRHGFETLGTADAAEATLAFGGFDPDLLLTDIDLGTRPSGAELAVMLVARAPHLGVVFLTSYPRAVAGARAMGLDRAGFVSKQSLTSPDELIAALEAALSTQSGGNRARASSGLDRRPLGRLTKRQLDVLTMVSRGWSNLQIAEASGASVRAVERTISRIFDRLELSGDPAVNPRVAAAAMYLADYGPAR